ncbi:MAG TPA: hypothetical protein VHV82_04415 [Sporichthyaceae bacterium]|nr:hypothetical protein [Sporichthyaceae bacterium]
MTWHDSAAGGPRHGAQTPPRAGSWRPGRVVAVVLTMAVVGAGTWLLGAGGSDRPASPPETSGVRSLPAGSAPPLAVAPPPGRSTDAQAGPTGSTSGSAHRPRSMAAGAH